ncbi:MAG: hypothetical protein QXO15_08245 [Nitrososphaerota archaeon]
MYAAFIPFKSRNWHSRLASILGGERQTLALYELAHVLNVLSSYASLYVGLQVGGLSQRDLEKFLLTHYQLWSVTIIEITDVNSGIKNFYEIIPDTTETVFICGSDLPNLQIDDVEATLNFKEKVVFSSAPDGGTPFYRIKKSGGRLYVPQLYVDGYTNTDVQIRRLEGLGISYRVITDRPGLCRDLDTEQDLKYFLSLGPDTPPIRYLRELKPFTCQNSF